MRLVIDTNVLVSGFLWKGPASEIIDVFFAGRFELCLSEELISELNEVLLRPRMQVQTSRRGLNVAEIIQQLRASVHLIAATPLPPFAVLRDPDDIIDLECAVSACADAIVRGDQDLLVLGAFAGIPILTPVRMLSELAK